MKENDFTAILPIPYIVISELVIFTDNYNLYVWLRNFCTGSFFKVNWGRERGQVAKQRVGILDLY